MGATPAEIRAFLVRQGELWNEGDRDGFLAAYRSIAPEGFHVENPVGSAVESGWTALEALWDKYQAVTQVSNDHILVADNTETAVLERISGEIDGAPFERFSIHTYTFDNAGMHVRYFSGGGA